MWKSVRFGVWERVNPPIFARVWRIPVFILFFQIGYKNMPKMERVPLSKEEVVKIVKDGFISAAERDIYTGDSVVVNIITKDGVQVERYPLRKD